MHNITPNKMTFCRDLFLPCCIISIDGYDLNFGRFQSRKNAPIFYGTVEDLKNVDTNEIDDLSTDEPIVRFIASG